MIDESTSRGRVVAAAVRLAAERPWSDITFFDIAEAAGMSLPELRQAAVSKSDILGEFSRQIDDQVLAKAGKPDASLSPRDRVFEVVMSRLDAMVPYRAALKSIFATGSADPSQLGRLLQSQVWMLRAAGLDTDGFQGSARVAGLVSVYASVFKTWLDDDDPGFARTMAALDRRLRRGERIMSRVGDAVAAVDRVASLMKSRSRNNPAPAHSANPAPTTPV